MKIFVFEGMDGSGKTTTVQAVATELQNLGFKVKTVCWLYDGVARDAVGRAASLGSKMGGTCLTLKISRLDMVGAA